MFNVTEHLWPSGKVWSSRKVQDSGSLDCEFEPTGANMFVSLDKMLSLNSFIIR